MFQEKALHREITSKQNVDNLSKGLLYVSLSYMPILAPTICVNKALITLNPSKPA